MALRQVLVIDKNLNSFFNQFRVLLYLWKHTNEINDYEVIDIILDEIYNCSEYGLNFTDEMLSKYNTLLSISGFMNGNHMCEMDEKYFISDDERKEYIEEIKAMRRKKKYGI